MHLRSPHKYSVNNSSAISRRTWIIEFSPASESDDREFVRLVALLPKLPIEPHRSLVPIDRIHSPNQYWPDLPIYAQWLRKAIESVCWKRNAYTRVSDNGDDSLQSVRASHNMSWGHIWRPISCCICRPVEGRGGVNGGASSSFFLNVKRIPFCVCVCAAGAFSLITNLGWLHEFSS